MFAGIHSSVISAEEIIPEETSVSDAEEVVLYEDTVREYEYDEFLKRFYCYEIEKVMYNLGCSFDEVFKAMKAVKAVEHVDRSYEWVFSYDSVMDKLEEQGVDMSGRKDELELDEVPDDVTLYYGEKEVNGRTYKILRGIDRYYSPDENVKISATDAVAAPGKITYVDISFDTESLLSIFTLFVDFDETALKLVSASINEEFDEDEETCTITDGINTLYLPTFQRSTTENYLLYARSGDAVNLSSESTIRLGFEVLEDAEEKTYEIGIECINLARGELALNEIGKMKYCGIEFPAAQCRNGSVTVSRTEPPKTNLKPKPIDRRMYAKFYDSKNLMTGEM